MTIAAPPAGLQPGEYEEIETALAETARGRRFLTEHARRARSAELERMLQIAQRLEAKLESQRETALPIPAQRAAPELIDRLRALSWSLRERGVEDFVCNKLDALAREFASAREFGDVGEVRAPASAPDTTPAPAMQPWIAQVENPAQDENEEQVENLPRGAPAASARDPRLEALLWLDSLSLVDRLALFA
jgi:hypothetical protein